MKINTSTALFAAAATTAISLLSGGAAQAFDLGPTWSYTMDSFKDGTEGRVLGSASDYEIYGVALKSENGIISVAFNANIGAAGHAYGSALGGNISWGDLFFNFSGLSFQDASAQGKLYGVRFSGNNDAGVSATGVYKDVTAKGVATQNSGHSGFNNYVNYVAGSQTAQGETGSAGLGGLTIEQGKDYFTSKTSTKTIQVREQYNVQVAKTRTIQVPYEVQVAKTRTIQVPYEVQVKKSRVIQVSQPVLKNGKPVYNPDGTPKTQLVNKTEYYYVTETRYKSQTETYYVTETRYKSQTETYYVTETRTRTVNKQVPVTVTNDSNIQNVISTGTKVGDITSLGANEIAALTTGFGQKGGIGTQTFGFSFAQSLLPAGKSVISVLLECINDSMALEANIPGQPSGGGGNQQVPEPFTMAGFALAGLGMAAKKMKQRRHA